MTRCLQDFGDMFARLQQENKTMTSDLSFIKKFFVGNNLDEVKEGYDYMLMIKETFSAFSKILDQRVRKGKADESSYLELDAILSDKPDNLVALASVFRNNFT